MAKTKEHVHQLRRHKYPNGTKIFFCIRDCSFKVETKFALGKIVLCNSCNQEFSMNEYSIRLSRPHCPDCSRQQVIEPDGTRRLVAKGTPVIANLGKSATESMRDRMSKVVQMEPEEDII